MISTRIAVFGFGGALALALITMVGSGFYYPTAQIPERPTITALVRVTGGEGGQWYTFDHRLFAEDLSERRTVFVAVHADWCPTCRAQEPVMTRLMRDLAFKDTIGYVVNFDREHRFLSTYQVRAQSTLIVFRDGREVARSVGETDEQRIRGLFAHAL